MCEVFGPMVIYMQVFIVIGLAGIVWKINDLKKSSYMPRFRFEGDCEEPEREATERSMHQFIADGREVFGDTTLFK